MTHRRARSLLAATATALLALAACGDGKDEGAPGTTGPDTTSPDTTAPDTTGPDTTSTPGGLSYPTDPDVALVRLGDEQFFPELLIGGDGWVYYVSAGSAGSSMAPGLASGRTLISPGAVPPPPQPMPMMRRQLSAEGLERVMSRAAELGLLAPPPDYPDVGVTDSPTTYVTLTDDAGTYRHSAYALGYDVEEGVRAKLLEFVEDLQDLESLVGSDQLGAEEPYRPAIHQVVLKDGFWVTGDDLHWPSSVELVEGCQQLPADQFPDGIAGTYLAVIDGVETAVDVIPNLPGDPCGP